MIRCGWCGAQNYAIDSWCSKCSRHLDWAPPSPPTTPAEAPPLIPAASLPSLPAATEAPPEPRRPRGRRGLMLLAPAAGVVVAIALAVPVASWFNAPRQAPTPALPNTAIRPATPTASATLAPTPQATPTPDSTPTPSADSGPTAEATPPAVTQPGQALVPPAGDPGASVARFYQAVSVHDFAGAAALWTPRMQSQYPPAEYIDHRFAATQQINLQAERMLGNGDGRATVYVDVVEIINGQRRHWVGTWQLVNTASGWLLNRPNLSART